MVLMMNKQLILLIPCSIFFISSIVCASTKVFFLFGPSQTGKSTWINTVAKFEGENKVAVGKANDRSSTTLSINVYKIRNEHLFAGQEFIVIDSPGLWDNRLSLSNEEIISSLKAAILTHTSGNSSLTGIIAFESLAGNLLSFPNYLPILEQIFGPSFLESTLLLFTKMDLTNKEYEKFALNEAAKKGLKFSKWNSLIRDSEKRRLLNEEEMALQLKSFEELVGYLKAYDGAGIRQMQEDLELLAQEIYDNQEKQEKISYVDVVDTIVKDNSVAKQDLQIEWTTKTVQVGTKTEVKTRSAKKTAGGIPGFFGKQKHYTETYTEEVPVFEEVKESRLINTTPNVSEAKIEYVTRQQEIHSWVSPWSLDYCRQLARQELIKKIHDKHF